MSGKVKVLIVDDSSFFRRLIAGIMEKEPSIEVVGMATNGKEAVSEARRLRPDVITMDVEMPVMDGITAVRQIMQETPTAILMFSSLTHAGARATLDALDAGAVDFLPKQFYSNQGRELAAEMLTKRVLAVGRKKGIPQSHSLEKRETVPRVSRVSRVAKKSHSRLVIIGASTGGPMAIQKLLATLPAGFPVPLLLVVHMPAAFTGTYAERLDKNCMITVKEAAEGDLLKPGHAYLAPGGKQMILEPRNGSAVIRIKESSADQIYRPSVDISFGSAAKVFPDSTLAVVLTGMGADGKQGAKMLKDNGSIVWSQNEQSCVVYGMPHAVEKAGLSDRVLSLDDIGPELAAAV
jgi:two-component system chemotaxis response regulator CheB